MHTFLKANTEIPLLGRQNMGQDIGHSPLAASQINDDQLATGLSRMIPVRLQAGVVPVVTSVVCCCYRNQSESSLACRVG